MKQLFRMHIATTVVCLLMMPPAIFADSTEKDPDQIGNRNVGKGVNFYSIQGDRPR
jgi:hypothetical protein